MVVVMSKRKWIAGAAAVLASVALIAAHGVSSSISLAGDEPTPQAKRKGETVTLTGRVVWLKDALERYDLKADAEALKDQLVLVGDDGTIHPLLKDDSSRAFFMDDRLRDRATRLTAKRFPGLPHILAITAKVESKDEKTDKIGMAEPEYYCDVCAISVRYPQICPCCQGPMELRMKFE